MKGNLCILLGLALLLVAGGLIARNEWEGEQAGCRADRVIEVLHRQVIKSAEETAAAVMEIDGYG